MQRRGLLALVAFMALGLSACEGPDLNDVSKDFVESQVKFNREDAVVDGDGSLTLKGPLDFPPRRNFPTSRPGCDPVRWGPDLQPVWNPAQRCWSKSRCGTRQQCDSRQRCEQVQRCDGGG